MMDLSYELLFRWLDQMKAKGVFNLLRSWSEVVIHYDGNVEVILRTVKK